MLDICSDMEKLCPDAWLMNYTNPMAIITWAINDYTKIKTVGLCHSVQSTAANLAKYMGVPANEVSSWVARHQPHGLVFGIEMEGRGCLSAAAQELEDPAVYSAAMRTGRGRMSYARK